MENWLLDIFQTTLRVLVSGYVNCEELLLRLEQRRTKKRGAGGDSTIIPLETENLRDRVDHGLRNTQ